jgi:ABC-2 type transport system ATP-binding protein
MIVVDKLVKSFDSELVLNGIDLGVEKGKIYGLVGSNGCGKTTVFKLITSIYKPDAGTIYYSEEAIDFSNYLNKMYYVQDDLFFPIGYSLDDLFDFEKMYYPEMSKEKFEQLKNYFNINSKKKLRSLSKGQKKQAAFILSIASMTETILLDEIVDGLDAVVRKKFWQVIMSEVMDRELTVMISSHALTELDNICDKVAILHEGKIVREDTIERMKEETRKVQYAVTGELKLIGSSEYELIKNKRIGSVYFAVIKGSVDTFKSELYELNEVLLFDELAMNLEEIFITELGGLGYGIEDYDS